MRTLRSLRIAAALFTALTAFGQPAAKRLIKVEDMHRFHDVRDPQISPDGKWIAYTLSTVDTVADKSDTDVWMVSWDGAQNLRVTSSPEAENAPRWSPDGRYLSFLSSRPGKAKGNQIWLLDRNGGEAQQFTDFKGRLSSYEWSPDSRKLLLTMADRDASDPADPADGEPPAGGGRGAPGKAPKPIVIDRYKFKQDVQGYLTQAVARIYLFDVATKKAEPLTSAESIEVASPAWSPDGKLISFLGKEGKDSDRYNTWNVYTMEARAGAAAHQLTHYDGIHGSASRGRAEWSPDGSRLVYLQSSGAKQGAYNMNRLAVISAAGGEPRVIAGKFDRGVSSPRFSTDGSSVLFLVADDRWEYPASLPANGGAVHGMVKGSGMITTLEQGKDGRMALLSASDTSHGEVYVLEDGTMRKLTHHNDALMAEFKLGATEEFSCKAKDGNEVHGLLVKPPDYEPGKKYPTLLRIHGGPNGQDGHSFSFERQLFAASGYVVVAVNYRGSSGRGEDYQVAISADWGNKEVIDLQAAMDYVVSIGLADPDRLGVGGWSYGGILTDAMIAKDHRFKAATSGAGTAFPIALYGVDQYIIQYDEEIGPPWKVGLEPWAKISYAFLHADQITTPTLFMGGEKDFNVPLVGGEQMYQALRSLGVPTQLVVYPGQFHGIARPSYQKDRMERYLAWYAKYLKRAEAVPTAAGQ
ncbi:MAG TPA: S9 family peptidase [Candidatus Acidoferrales bacterium]|jgi:dipeptidyl aminopeptidase/acylaminoacyl peptidase|nr:S9 family peptidase [Candidatus Acidoferrales bacterium]